ncbi:hypothetical protein FNAPI_13445 [Fusarium napiforme]|uniref:Uncharacterized protein n=1 Tax=Fusarium napiforme TaxID=42672 RepID=A0A8H5MK48_9HYPO|nr:hypothetical protein FNAPI_13445 [Fusarium napiforme]
MDEPEPEDKNIEMKVWQAAIAAMEEHIGAETRQEGIFVRAALILMDGSTRSVYDNQVWNKIRGRSDALKEICGWES